MTNRNEVEIRIVQNNNEMTAIEACTQIQEELQTYINNNGFFSRLGRAIRSFSFEPLRNHHLDVVESALRELQRYTNVNDYTAPVIQQTLIALLREPVEPDLHRGATAFSDKPINLYDDEFRSSIHKVRRAYNNEGTNLITAIWNIIERIAMPPSDNDEFCYPNNEGQVVIHPYYYETPKTYDKNQFPTSWDRPRPTYYHDHSSPPLHLAIAFNESDGRITHLVNKHLQRGSPEDLQIVKDALTYQALGTEYWYDVYSGLSSRSSRCFSYENLGAVSTIIEAIQRSGLTSEQKLNILGAAFEQSAKLKSSRNKGSKDDIWEEQRRIPLDDIANTMVGIAKTNGLLNINAFSETLNNDAVFAGVLNRSYELQTHLHALSPDKFTFLRHCSEREIKSLLGERSLDKIHDVVHALANESTSVAASSSSTAASSTPVADTESLFKNLVALKNKGVDLHNNEILIDNYNQSEESISRSLERNRHKLPFTSQQNIRLITAVMDMEAIAESIDMNIVLNNDEYLAFWLDDIERKRSDRNNANKGKVSEACMRSICEHLAETDKQHSPETLKKLFSLQHDITVTYPDKYSASRERQESEPVNLMQFAVRSSEITDDAACRILNKFETLDNNTQKSLLSSKFRYAYSNWSHREFWSFLQGTNNIKDKVMGAINRLITQVFSERHQKTSGHKDQRLFQREVQQSARAASSAPVEPVKNTSPGTNQP
ncbi:hypothetical protein Lgee_0109 [Legionella geestiana]|uniref:Uncharacterized protein n=1 Tax=Legionella geestiana TaxID=45065 RepID=A0A0W0U964_9GAMM|nr:hypothetical protein [Legionella geestiana]KTD04499.1 hypothetical protein Lgee_0109 [Legionella geestiana]QBS12268.1 hypothetical protein E4T54_05635 [Legionella geestiana]STX52997.1 Uncharacterised protein [Legionella geestiana]